MSCIPRGGSRIFSRGGGGGGVADFYNFLILKKQSGKGVFRHFLENFDKKSRFFGARAPLEISI